MIEKKLNAAGEFYFKDLESDHYFRRIICSISWPFNEKPGWVLAIGEHEAIDQASGRRILRLLHEDQDDLVERLLHKLRAAKELHRVDRVYGDPRDETMMFLLNQHNRELERKGIARIGIDYAPMSDKPNNLSLYLQRIKNHVPDQGMKTLYFGEGTQVAESLLSISRTEAEGDVAEYPSVAALGYGVLALETYSPEPTRERLQEKAITEYDPFAL